MKSQYLAAPSDSSSHEATCSLVDFSITYSSGASSHCNDDQDDEDEGDDDDGDDEGIIPISSIPLTSQQAEILQGCTAHPVIGVLQTSSFSSGPVKTIFDRLRDMQNSEATEVKDYQSFYPANPLQQMGAPTWFANYQGTNSNSYA